MVIVEEGDSVYSLPKTLSRDEMNSALPERERGGGGGAGGSGQNWLATWHEGRGI